MMDLLIREQLTPIGGGVLELTLEAKKDRLHQHQSHPKNGRQHAALSIGSGMKSWAW